MMNRSRSHSVYHSFFIKLSEHIKYPCADCFLVQFWHNICIKQHAFEIVAANSVLN